MIPIKHGSLKEIFLKFFLSQILPTEESIHGKIKYENFMIDVSLIYILNLICLVYIFFKYLIFILTSIDLFSIYMTPVCPFQNNYMCLS